jgi:hypothetical protein
MNVSKINHFYVEIIIYFYHLKMIKEKNIRINCFSEKYLLTFLFELFNILWKKKISHA